MDNEEIAENMEDAQAGDQTDLPPPPPEVKQSSSDQQQHRSNIYPETLKRRSMVQSLPSDYSDVQPRSYDPEFISDISNKMQVPDTISMMGHGEKSGSQMGWQEPMQRNEMRVPDRIMVAGGGQHIGARHDLRPLHFDGITGPHNDISYGLMTPPRVLTVDEQFPNLEEEGEEEEPPVRIPNGALVQAQTPQTPGEMNDSLVLYDEDQAQLRNQLIKLSRRVAVMEKEQQTLANRTMVVYSATIGYFMLKFVWWLFRNK